MSVSFPTDAEARELAPAPGSICWERASDLRTMLGAGPALLLQVAHPTVGAGVAQHSDFRRDPWGRLFRTLDFVNMIIYGGPEGAARTGRAVREMHKRIKGTKPDGSRYHALEPEAYAWVHATLAWVIIEAHGRFGEPFSFSEKRRFWREWLNVGRFLAVPDGELPSDWPGLERYVDAMIDERLDDNDTVRDVLGSLEARITPPFPGSKVLWPVLRPQHLAARPPAAQARPAADARPAARDARARARDAGERARAAAGPEGVGARLPALAALGDRPR